MIDWGRSFDNWNYENAELSFELASLQFSLYMDAVGGWFVYSCLSIVPMTMTSIATSVHLNFSVPTNLVFTGFFVSVTLILEITFLFSF